MNTPSSLYGMLQGTNAAEQNPEEFAALQQDRTRQAIAQMLLARGMQQPQGQMVGRFYVPPALMQNVGGLIQSAIGAGGMAYGDQQLSDTMTQVANNQKAAQEQFMRDIGPQQAQLPMKQMMVPGTGGRFPVTEAEMPSSASNWDVNELQGGPTTGLLNIPPQMGGRLPGEDTRSHQTTEQWSPMVPQREVAGMLPTQQTMPTTTPASTEQVRQAMLKYQTGVSPKFAEAMKFYVQQRDAEEQKQLDRENRIHERIISFNQAMAQAVAMGATKQQIETMKETFGKQLEEMKQTGANTRDNLETVVRQDRESPTGWSLYDLRSKERLMTGVAPPSSAVQQDKIGKAPNKGELPTNALRMVKDEADDIALASGIRSDLGSIRKQIDSGKLNLGLFSNYWNTGRNIVGMSSEESRNYESFRKTLEKMRNDSLRLNKGTQTEGDAVRAWNELLGNLNDDQYVKQRLSEIEALNDRAAHLRRMNIEMIYKNYNVEPPDLSGYFNQPAVVGEQKGTDSGGWSIKSETPKVRKYNPATGKIE